jgi:hypothetical protein
MVIVFVVASLAIFGVVGAVVFGYAAAIGLVTWARALWGLPCVLMAVVFGYVCWRFISRMLCIRRIRLLDKVTIEIVKWRGAVLRARFPQDLEQIVRVDDDWTMHVKVGSRRLIISAEEFSDSAIIKAWVQNGIDQAS